MKAKILNQTAQHENKLCKLWERKSLVLVLLFIMNGITLKTFAQADKALEKMDKHYFIENKGQWDKDVLFLTQLNGLNVWITNKGVTYDYYRIQKENNSAQENLNKQNKEPKPINAEGQLVRINLDGINEHLEANGAQKCEAYYNYFIGNDKKKWASHVGLYKEVTINNVYNGIGERYYFENGTLRYDYILNPNTNFESIKMNLEGTNKFYINNNGELVYEIKFGEIKQAKLFCYQLQEGVKKEISCKFLQFANGNIGFDIGEYDKNYPLVIDPLIYSTFLGGSDWEYGNCIALDATNHAYIAGGTWSANFPGATTSAGGWNHIFTAWADGFIAKFKPNGSDLDYWTFIGGSGWDWFHGIDVDIVTNRVYVTGDSHSHDFPNSSIPGTTSYPSYQTINYGTNFPYSDDAIACILDATGSILEYSTYVGGSMEDYGNGIKIEQSNGTGLKKFYITGYTAYNGNGTIPYPVTPGAFSTIYNNTQEVFVSKIDPTLGASGLLYSTYLGGYGKDIGNAITLGGGYVYVTGSTDSPGFPATIGTSNGMTDVFVTCFRQTLAAPLVYSTRFGSTNDDVGNSIALNSANEAFVTGNAGGGTLFPLYLNNVVLPTGTYPYGGGISDVFVTSLTNSGLIKDSRLIGGLQKDGANSIALDGSSNVYITGFTYSGGVAASPPVYPTTICSYDPIGKGNDAIVTKLNPNLSTIQYSTLIGGIFDDTGFGIAVDASGAMYFTGGTTNTTYTVGVSNPNNYYPVTSGAFDETFNGIGTISNGGYDGDIFVTKLTTDYPSPCTNQGTSLLSGTIFTAPPFNVNGYQINGNLIIGASMSLSGLDMVVTGAYSITVNSGATLTIDATHLQGCSIMWTGIILLPGGRLNVINNSLIEDANIAIDINAPTSNTTILYTDNAIFNRNSIGIRITKYNQTILNYPFIIKNSVFTSRNLYADCTLSSWPYWYTVPQLKITNTAANALTSPYFMQNAPVLGLKNGQPRSLKHIELNNVGQTIMSGSVPTYFEEYIGANTVSEMNLFDNASLGIDGVNSNFATVNAVFQNMQYPESIGTAGVRATKNYSAPSGIPSLNYRVRCEPVTTDPTLNNKFYDCFKGIESTNYYTNLLNKNEFYSLQTTALLSTSTNGTQVNANKVGLKAIDVISVAYDNIDITKNSIFNHAVGILQVSGAGSITAGFTQIKLGKKTINDNRLQDQPIAGQVPTAFLGDALVVSLVNGTGTTPVSNSGNPFLNYIQYNKIVNAYRGIAYSNFAFTWLKTIIEQNNIRLAQDFYPNNFQTGIKTTRNTNLVLDMNTSQGIGNQTNNSRFTNFESISNIKQDIGCNRSWRTYTGFKYALTNLKTNWQMNSMDNDHYYGLSLENAGIIGQQGMPNDAIDNQWLGAYNASGGHTNIDFASDAVNSILYVRGSILPYKPTINQGISTFSYNALGNLQTATLPTNPKVCGGIYMLYNPNILPLLDDIVLNHIPFSTHIAENEWLSNQQVYEFQIADTSYINADSLLTNFFYNTCPQGIKTVHKIEDKIDAGDYGCAQTLVNNFTPTNNIEQNYKDYYKLLLPYLTTGTWSDNVEGIALLNLANKCIYTNGLIISNARVLYNSIYREQFTIFNDECISDEDGEHGGGHGNKIGNSNNIANTSFEVEVYPNPTEKGFDLKSNCKENCSVNVAVININGQKIVEKICNLTEGNCFINTSLSNGVYLVSITKLDTKEQIVRRLLINKK